MLVFHGFSLYIKIYNIVLSFTKSWANPVVVRVVEVIVVQVTTSVNIPHVVIIVSRTQPESKKDNREPILALPILFIY